MPVGWWVTPTIPEPVSVTGWWAENHIQVVPSAGSFAVSGSAPTVNLGKAVLSSGASLTVTGAAPTVTATQHHFLTPTGASLSLIGSHPALGVTLRPAGASLSVTGGTPTVTLNQIVTPTPASLTVSGSAPTVTTPQTITPTPGAVTVTGSAPTVTVGTLITPTAAALTVTGSAATVTATANQVATPSGASLTVTGGVPTLGLALRPAGAALSITGGTPTIAVVSPISFVNSNISATTTVTTATHASGDLLIITAWGTFSIIPSLPAGWTTPTNGTNSGNGVGGRVGSKVATTTNDSSGTWTSANVCENSNYSGASGIGAVAFNTGSSTTITYPAITLQDTSGSSWVLRVAAHTGASSGNFTAATLSGYTQRQEAAGPGSGRCIIWDTNGGVTSAGSLAQSVVNTTGTWQAFSIEILT